MNDQTAQMGFQVGKTAVMAGQEYMEQNVRHSAELLPSLTDSTVDKSLHFHWRSKALLQRHNPIRSPQTPSRPFPLAPQALVPSTTALNHRLPGLEHVLLLLPSPSR